MREILFRGKTRITGNWIYGFYGENTTTKEPQIVGKNDFCYSLVIPETVGQYTGLTDKNATKIFEGDIVRIEYSFGWDYEQEKIIPEEEYISRVYAIDGCPFCVDLQHCEGDMTPIAWLYWSYDYAEIEVIGNIHDNPELLKGGAEL